MDALLCRLGLKEMKSGLSVTLCARQPALYSVSFLVRTDIIHVLALNELTYIHNRQVHCCFSMLAAPNRTLHSISVHLYCNMAVPLAVLCFSSYSIPNSAFS